MTYAEKLKDPRWQRKRLEVMQRDDFKCRDCGTPDQQLTVHHCHYERGEPWKTNASFLLTLCGDCHKTRQIHEDELKRAIGSLIASSQIDDVMYFRDSAVQQVETGKCLCPVVSDGNWIEYVSEIRWWTEAAENKSFRKIYGRITGSNTNWKQYDKRRKEDAE